MPLPVAALAAQAGLSFFKKYPWALIVLIVLIALPMLLVGGGIASVLGTVSNHSGNQADGCSADYKSEILGQFKDDDLAQKDLLSDCPKDTGGNGSGAAAGTAPDGKVTFSKQGWTKPVGGSPFIISPFGPRPPQCGPNGCGSTFHLGDDLAVACGTPDYAVHDATVVVATDTIFTKFGGGGYGNHIILDFGGGVGAMYGHLQGHSLLVGVGDKVKAGQRIASVGTTGTSFGCHTHFEIRLNGVQTNPVPFMQNVGIQLP